MIELAELRAAGLVIRPGDTLILTFNRPMTAEEVHKIGEQIEAKLPGVRVALVDQASGLAAYRPEPIKPPEPCCGTVVG